MYSPALLRALLLMSQIPFLKKEASAGPAKHAKHQEPLQEDRRTSSDYY